MPWYQKLHWRIIIGLVLGLIYGVIASYFHWQSFTFNWISPWGEIFIRLLKMIAVPLVITSLATGVASLSDVKKLSRIGGKTIGIYIGTTAVAVTIGLLLVNLLQPGAGVPEDLKNSLQKTYQSTVDAKTSLAKETKKRRPLQPLVDMVPANITEAAASNRNMLQVVFLSIVFGIALIQISSKSSKPVVDLLKTLNEVVLHTVDVIMVFAPIGVFALLANTIVTVAGDDLSKVIELISALGFYCFVVVLGLTIHSFIVFPILLKFFTPMKLTTFLKGIAPVQLLAFSTSSSGATLPLTMERCEKNLGVSEEVASFVLPLGSTINMDGTALYQAVAAVFISQALGLELSLGAQLTIVFTAVLASIGTAAVPGAGIIMLVVILEAIGVPSSGIALILGVDRILDMLRTVTNVTGDATVSILIASGENQLGKPHVADKDEPHVRYKR